jgi:hypothetical protein
VPSKELPPHTELRRAPLLEAQVEIQLAAGDVEAASVAANDLSSIAATFESKALVASAALARGRVRLAEGDTTAARQDFDTAARLWREIGAPYETALAQMGLARVFRAAADEQRALREFKAARYAFEQVGAMHLAAEAALAGGEAGRESAPHGEPKTGARPTSGAYESGENVFRREGDYWLVEFEGRAVRLHDAKGLHHLARLFAEPGRELHVLDMVASERAGIVGTSSEGKDVVAVGFSMDAGVLLDAQAKAAYRRRLAEIEDDIDEARLLGDDERAAQAEAERDFLARELSRAVGLGGRDRHAGSSSERARASVTRALRQAMVRITEHHPMLGEHLRRAIRTGTYCRYLPDPRVPTTWKL